MRPGIGTSYYFLPFSYHMIIFLLNYSPRKRNKCEVGPTEICHSARYLSIFIVLCLDQRLYYKGYSFIMSYYFRPFWTPFIPHLSLDYPLYPPPPVQWALMLRIVKIRCYLFCTVIGVSAALHQHSDSGANKGVVSSYQIRLILPSVAKNHPKSPAQWRRGHSLTACKIQNGSDLALVIIISK